MSPSNATDTDAHEALFDAWTREYVLLGLRMDRLAPGTVDAWLGPPAWREAVLREAPPTPQELLAKAASLLDRLQGMRYDGARVAYLERQVTGLDAVARLLGGAAMSVAEQAALFFDIQPTRVSESVFEEAHSRLEALLPGSGSLAERNMAWRRQFEVAPARVLPLLDGIATELRARTLEHLVLPADERIEITLVQGQPWGAYNWYLGAARSRIEVNIDLPLRADILVDYMAHEGYPGHHTEHLLRELQQYRQQGHGEYAIQLINTPESLISEAIATSACELIFPDDRDLAWAATEVLPALDLQVDPMHAAQIRAAGRALEDVRGNAVFLLHEDGRSLEEVAAYVARWSLIGEEEARKRLGFVQSPLWRVYSFTYIYGHRLLAPLLTGPDRFALFKRVLTEPVTPTLLAQWQGKPA